MGTGYKVRALRGKHEGQHLSFTYSLIDMSAHSSATLPTSEKISSSFRQKLNE